jgi:hypothetical protein
MKRWIDPLLLRLLFAFCFFRLSFSLSATNESFDQQPQQTNAECWTHDKQKLNKMESSTEKVR